MSRPSRHDLDVAADWLDAYEPAPDDPNGPSIARTAGWLRTEARLPGWKVRRPPPDDLGIAADWLDAYDPAPDDPAGPPVARVAAWIGEKAHELGNRYHQEFLPPSKVQLDLLRRVVRQDARKAGLEVGWHDREAITAQSLVDRDLARWSDDGRCLLLPEGL